MAKKIKDYTELKILLYDILFRGRSIPYNISTELDDLVKYRLANAKEKLKSAKLLLDAGYYKDSIGRSCYAIFTSVRAVLSRDKVDFSKHAGVIAYNTKISHEKRVYSIVVLLLSFLMDEEFNFTVFPVCRSKDSI